MLLLVLVFILLICALYLYRLSTKQFNYWKNNGVPFAKPLPLFGNYKNYLLIKEFGPKIAQTICNEFPNSPYVGSYYGTEPALIIQDPELIKLVMTKDFDHFSGREGTDYSHKEKLAQHLFFTKGESWKLMRKTLTSQFTIAKLMNMTKQLQECTKQFKILLEEENKVTNIINVKGLAVRFTMDNIGAYSFGVNTEAMNTKIQNNPFTIIGYQIINTSSYRTFQIIMWTMWPKLFYALGFKLYPPQIYSFFSNMLSRVIVSRNHEQSSKQDFVDYILKWNKNECINGDKKINENNEPPALLSDILIAQCLMVFAAGFHTTAATISFALYELAKKPEIQMRVMQEVDTFYEKYYKDNKIDFEYFNELVYLEACMNETLRMYPLLGILPRETVKDYTFPTGLHIKKGIRVHIPVYHLHYNPKYYPDPETFKPERFIGKEKQNIIPYTYIPFGAGPRKCLGMQFGKMVVLAALLVVFKNYRLELAEGTPQKLQLHPKGFTTETKEDINLKFISREQD